MEQDVRVGDTRSDATIQVIAEPGEYERGEVRFKHPRHGRVVLKRDGDSWRITEVQYPEGKPR